MKKIIYYKNNGTFHKEEELTLENLKHTSGMMSKCSMEDGSVYIGYADPLRTNSKSSLPFDDEVHDFIYLGKWENLDEESHQLIGNDEEKYNQIYQKIDIEKILKMECILYSNPRWGGVLTNRFYYFKNDKN